VRRPPIPIAIDVARPVPDLSNANDALTLAYIQAVLKHSTLGDVDKGLWINAAYQEPFQPPPPPPLKMWKIPGIIATLRVWLAS
jgi:hypothetical protein